MTAELGRGGHEEKEGGGWTMEKEKTQGNVKRRGKGEAVEKVWRETDVLPV